MLEGQSVGVDGDTTAGGWYIRAPEGAVFDRCEKCNCIYIKYGSEKMCLWCEIHKEG